MFLFLGLEETMHSCSPSPFPLHAHLWQCWGLTRLVLAFNLVTLLWDYRTLAKNCSFHHECVQHLQPAPFPASLPVPQALLEQNGQYVAQVSEMLVTHWMQQGLHLTTQHGDLEGQGTGGSVLSRQKVLTAPAEFPQYGDGMPGCIGSGVWQQISSSLPPAPPHQSALQHMKALLYCHESQPTNHPVVNGNHGVWNWITDSSTRLGLCAIRLQ